MHLKLYNTLTRQFEEFKPLNKGGVTMYTCGPTVYNRVHIGNLRSFVVADTLKRTIIANAYNLQYVMNITDVDDKTIKKANEQTDQKDPKKALMKVTREFENKFIQDVVHIGNDLRDVKLVRATDNIEAMQKLIEGLYNAGIAYFGSDGVYFSIDAYKNAGHTYGQLVDIDLEQDNSRSRINNDEYDKDTPHDFALWKIQKDNEPAWSFVLDGKDITGRPGWHIECSAMSTRYLNQPFDIHTGGVDLKFPHHENEIAQSTGANGQQLCQTFLHSEHLLVDGKKMSKSLGNFHTLDDLADKNIDPLDLRLLFLQSHYRTQLNYTDTGIQSAREFRMSLRAAAALIHQPTNSGDTFEPGDTIDGITAALNDDLATPRALALLSDKLNDLQPLSKKGCKILLGFLQEVDKLLGLDLSKVSDISRAAKAKIKARQSAKVAGNFDLADDIRTELLKSNIGLNDHTGLTVWFWTN